MSWVKPDIDTTMGLSVGPDVEITFRVAEQDPSHITLEIGNSLLEIDFDAMMVEALRDKADAALPEFRQATAQRPAAELVGAARVVS